MFSQVGCDYVFEHFAQNTCEWYRAIIAGYDLSPFLKMGDTFASFQKWGSFPESSDFWKVTCSIGASSAWRVRFVKTCPQQRFHKQSLIF